MPTFPTPEPLDVSIQLVVADVRISASDRPDTSVTVRPSSDTVGADVSAAEQVRVELTNGRLEVKTIKSWKLVRRIGPFGGSGSVDVRIDLPTGSRIEADLAMGAFHSEGVLGRCRFRTGMGNIRLDEVGAVELKTGFGDIGVDIVTGTADLVTGSGRLRIGSVRGDAVLRNANGPTEVGVADAELRVKSSSGRIDIARAGTSTVAKTAHGGIRIGGARQGTVVAETGFGPVEIGIREGTAAWLDLASQHGDVRNSLDAAGGPATGDDTVEVRARTAHGDITVLRSIADDAAAGSPRTNRSPR